MGKPATDLSEMYIVRAGYLERAENYLRRQGAAAEIRTAAEDQACGFAFRMGVNDLHPR